MTKLPPLYHGGPPTSVNDLLIRARRLCGLSIGELAQHYSIRLNSDPKRAKGRPGEIVERALGALAGNKSIPDFPDLGIEVKTIPLNARGQVQESTYICAIDLDSLSEEIWDHSRLWRKIQRILWIPVDSAKTAPLADRRIGWPLLWEPTKEELACLKADWTLITGKLAIGAFDEISAHLGQILQVRPKARRGSVRVQRFASDGSPLSVLPKGFYLRARFTEHLLWRLTASRADATTHCSRADGQ